MARKDSSGSEASSPPMSELRFDTSVTATTSIEVNKTLMRYWVMG